MRRICRTFRFPLLLLGTLLLALFAALTLSGCAGYGQKPVALDAATSASEAADAADDTEPALYSNVSVAVRRKHMTVSTRDIADEADILIVERIVFDHLVKSAAWEGDPASTLADCVILSFDTTAANERQTYYQFERDGRHVLQFGEKGMYTIMGDEAYFDLMRLAGISP